MSAKKLDQSVFGGLPPEYRWAAVDRFGVCAAFTKMPVPAENGSGWRFDDGKMKTLWCSNERRLSYFMIERQDVLTAADIDWIEGAAYWCKPFPPIQPSGFFINADFTQVHDGISWVQALPQVKDLQDGTYSKHVIKRESITDVARSIEAARIEERACMPWPDGDPRYFETSEPYAGLPKTNMLADAVGKFHATASESTKEMIKKMIAGKLAACIQDEQAERTYPHYFKDVSGVDAIDLYHVAQLYEITDPALFHAFKKIACAGKRGAKDQAQDVQEAIDALKRWQELSA